jgi:hypothetical protein
VPDLVLPQLVGIQAFNYSARRGYFSPDPIFSIEEAGVLTVERGDS